MGMLHRAIDFLQPYHIKFNTASLLFSGQIVYNNNNDKRDLYSANTETKLQL